MKKSIYAAATVFLVFSVQAQAVMITYEQISQTGNRYEYNYQITNNSINDGMEEFSIYFDYSLYENLDISASPTGWDPLVLQSDLALFEDGVADWLALSAPLNLGETLGGFNIAFDFMGNDITELLGAQSFDVFNANFDIIASGFTEGVNVPEPGSLVLFSLGIVAYGRFLHSKK